MLIGWGLGADPSSVASELLQSAGGALRIGGTFDVTCIRDGKVAWKDRAKNAVTNVGMNHILNVEFNSTTQVTTWYLGLVDNSGWTAFAAADTASSHSGWTESTAYGDATRRTWGTGSSTAQSVSNSSTVNFSINATATIKGIFCISDNTKGGTTGTLFSTVAFTAGNQTVASGDTLQVTYTLSATTS